MKHDGLGRLRTPVLVEDFRAVGRLDKTAAHFIVPFDAGWGRLGLGKASGGEQGRRRETGSSGENATPIEGERHRKHGRVTLWRQLKAALCTQGKLGHGPASEAWRPS